MPSVICPSCKSPAPQGALFCDNCGYDLRMVPAADEEKVPPTFVVPSAGIGESICPNCGHSNVIGSVFCENCGTQLPQQPAPHKPAVAQPQKAVQSPVDESNQDVVPEYPAPVPDVVKPKLEYIPGRLLLTVENISISIPPGKDLILLGREDPVSGIFPDIDFDPHGGHESGVGRRHAQLILRDNEVLIEDLDSVNGTVVNKLRVKPREPVPIKHGDEIRLGKMVLIYMTG